MLQPIVQPKSTPNKMLQPSPPSGEREGSTNPLFVQDVGASEGRLNGPGGESAHKSSNAMGQGSSQPEGLQSMQL